MAARIGFQTLFCVNINATTITSELSDRNTARDYSTEIEMPSSSFHIGSLHKMQS